TAQTNRTDQLSSVSRRRRAPRRHGSPRLTTTPESLGYLADPRHGRSSDARAGNLGCDHRPHRADARRRPMKIHNPFRLGFIATLGVGLAYILLQSVQSLSTVLLYVGTALFISLGLDPVVSWLERRRLPRWSAVLIAIVGVLTVFVGILLIIIPVLIEQVSQLVRRITLTLNRSDWQADAEQWIGSTFPNLDVNV